MQSAHSFQKDRCKSRSRLVPVGISDCRYYITNLIFFTWNVFSAGINGRTDYTVKRQRFAIVLKSLRLYGQEMVQACSGVFSPEKRRERILCLPPFLTSYIKSSAVLSISGKVRLIASNQATPINLQPCRSVNVVYRIANKQELPSFY